MANPSQITCPACGTVNQAQNTICSNCSLTLPTPPQPILLLTTGNKQVVEGVTSSPTASSATSEQFVDLSSLAGYHQTPGYAPSTVPPLPPSEEMVGMVGQPPSKHGISRRTVIISLVSLGVAATAGITLYTLTQSSVFSPSPALFTYRGHSQDVTSVAWSPDGKRIVSTSYDETAQVWEPLTGKQFVIFRDHAGVVHDAAWSPDGSRIVSCGSGAIQIWDAITGKVSLSYSGHTQPVNAVAWSPDGKRIASVSENVQVWDAASGKRFYTIGSPSDSSSKVVAWSPDGLYLAICPPSSINTSIRKATTGEPVFDYTGHTANSLAWSPDSQLIASGFVDVEVWKLVDHTAELLFIYSGHLDVVNKVAWSPDSKRIASASGYYPSGTTDNTVQVWDATTGDHPYIYNGHSGPVTGVTWSPDGKYLASSSADKTVQVWQAS